jgi:DNA polymerase family A
MIACLDTETFYSKDYSIKELSNWQYVMHPEFECYLMSVAIEDGFVWVGPPEEFDWPKWALHEWVIANAGFDQAVLWRLQQLGKIPKLEPRPIYDVLDMARFLKVPGNLKDAYENLCGKELSKDPIAKMKGIRWADAPPELKAEIIEYAKIDATSGLEIFLSHKDEWPLEERELSAETLRMTWAGMPTDVEGAKADVEILKKKLEENRKLIPWPDPPLSPKSVKAMCMKHNIQPPRTMAKDSASFEAWLFRHGDKHPWAAAMGKHRSINMLLKKYETMLARTDENGIHRYGLKYFGGHTGRDSGASGFNAQNCSRKPMHGVYLRNRMIKAPEGYVLGIVDEAQIEPRALALLSGDNELVEMMRAGMDVYEARARIDGEYDDPRPLKEVNKDLRQYNKVKVLACGYGAGPAKVQFIAKKEVGLILSDEEAARLTYKFRDRPFIPDLWKRLEWDMRRSKREGFYEIELPSGRTILYQNIKDFGGLSAEVVKYGKLTRLPWWGGSICENLIQSCCRDIFMYHVLRIKEAGHNILLRAHDEVVTLHRIETAEAELSQIVQIMKTPPVWMPEFPAGAEGHLSPVYTKF